jgi:hypothetical protein
MHHIAQRAVPVKSSRGKIERNWKGRLRDWKDKLVAIKVREVREAVQTTRSKRKNESPFWESTSKTDD